MRVYVAGVKVSETSVADVQAQDLADLIVGYLNSESGDQTVFLTEKPVAQYTTSEENLKDHCDSPSHTLAIETLKKIANCTTHYDRHSDGDTVLIQISKNLASTISCFK